jgi:hypothetical protein
MACGAGRIRVASLSKEQPFCTNPNYERCTEKKQIGWALVKVPADKALCAQTQCSLEYFSIGQDRLRKDVLYRF